MLHIVASRQQIQFAPSHSELPNVQGQAIGPRGAATSYSGSLTLTQTGTYDYLGAQQGGVLTLNIDASKYSSIYKNTSKINVRSYYALMIIKS